MNLYHLIKKIPEESRDVVKVCIYGVFASLLAVSFHFAIDRLYRATLVRFSHMPLNDFLLDSFLTIVGSALLAGWILRQFCPTASGSGIPQLKVSFWKDFGYVPPRVIWVKWIAGFLCIGGGMSLGREGPSVQMGGGLASWLAGNLGDPKSKHRMALSTGAASGLAAAFNTPLASVTFVLEEIVQNLNSRLLGGVLLASVIGALVTHGIIGAQPAFSMQTPKDPSWIVFAILPLVSALSALIGVCFHKSIIHLREKRTFSSNIPQLFRLPIAAVITWLLGVSVFIYTGHLGVFGLGYEDLSDALSGKMDWKIAGLLLSTKFIAIVICYALGGCGGIFAPTLFLGGMCGIVVSGVIQPCIPNLPISSIVLAVVGMSSCLGAVVGAPVTGILIVFEMTHDFNLVPALMLGALISHSISKKMLKHHFYDEIIQQDGHRLEHVFVPRDLTDWHRLPAAVIANYQPIVLTSLDTAELHQILEEHPYQQFPVCLPGKPPALITRAEALESMEERRAPKLMDAITCPPNISIRVLQRKLVESTSGVVLIQDPGVDRPQGLITMHDLLRAEIAASDGLHPAPKRRATKKS